MLKKYIFGWDKLRVISRNKIVSSTYIWLIIVPVMAKLTSKLEDIISFEVSGKVYQLDIVLPFSWQLFFLSALAFVIGEIIYFFSCPKIIKDYQDVSEFLATRRYIGELDNYANDDELKKKCEEHVKIYVEPLQVKPGLEVPMEKRKIDMFWIIYNYYLSKKVIPRRIAWFFYFIGFMLFFIVAIDNIMWVLPQISVVSIIK